MSLRLDWCSHDAAKYAVMHWHYSARMPKSKLVKIGVWEHQEFIGAIIFGVGATADMAKQFDIGKWDACELVRIALKQHSNTVTKILSIALRLLKQQSPDIRLIVSYADPEYGHEGTIYQAANWTYTGMTQASEEYIVRGKRWHGRAWRASKPAHLSTKESLELADPNYEIVMGSSKHRYCYPLDRAMREQITPLAKPYPKKVLDHADT